MPRDAPLSAVRAATARATDGATVVALLGARGSRPATLADAALGTALAPDAAAAAAAARATATAETSSASSSSSVVVVVADAAPPPAVLVAAPAAQDVGAVALIHAALGDDSTPSDEAADAAALAVALAGVVVLNARAVDLDRPTAGGAIPALAAAVGDAVDLRASAAAAAVPQRRLLLVAVRDFDFDGCGNHGDSKGHRARDGNGNDDDDDDRVDIGIVEEAVTEHLCAAYADVEHRSAALAAAELTDIFDIQFVFLPNDRLFPAQFADAAAAVRRCIEDAPRNGYTDAGMTPAGLDAAATRIWDALREMREPGGAKRELPADRELAATFACDKVMKNVFERYAMTVRNWRATVDSGRIIRDFGKESGNLISSTLDKYAADSSSYRSTKAFARKKDELRLLCLSDAYALYAKQILKLREVAYQVFRRNLAPIRISDRVEKNVNIAVKDAESYFVEKAESLRCPLSNWRFDNERHELVNHMREDATERLQLARLQGNYVPPIRAPVAVAFHTLMTAPFGHDSRVPLPIPEELMGAKRDKDKVKKASLSRSRPHQRRGRIVSAEKLDVVGAAELFRDFFTEESK